MRSTPILIVGFAILVWVLTPPDSAIPAPADFHRWQRATSSWYGPGFYGNRTACGQQLTTSTRGVAHRSLPCGARVTLIRGGRRVTTRVIDRGPYVGGRTFDLTGRTARDLCGCRRPYTMTHRWRRGR